MNAIRFWTRLEDCRKRPWQLFRRFGTGNFLRLLMRGLSLEEAVRRASLMIGVDVMAQRLPFPEAALDVDNGEDLTQVSLLLRARSAAQQPLAEAVVPAMAVPDGA